MVDESPKVQKSKNSLLDPGDDDNSWRRSQSDGSFFRAENPQKNPNISGRTDKVSEHSAVYWNIAEAVEESSTSERVSSSRGFAPHESQEHSHKSPTSARSTNLGEIDLSRKPGPPFHSGTVLLSEVLERPPEFVRPLEPLRRQHSPASRQPYTGHPDIFRKHHEDQWAGATTSLYKYKDKQSKQISDYSCYSTESRLQRTEMSEDMRSSTTSTISSLDGSRVHRNIRYLKDQLKSLETTRFRIGIGLNEEENKNALKALDACDDFLNAAGQTASTGDTRSLLREMCNAVLGTVDEFLDSSMDSKDLLPNPDAAVKLKLMSSESTPSLNHIGEAPVQATNVMQLSQEPELRRAVGDQPDTQNWPKAAVGRLVFQSTRILNRLLRITDVSSLSKEKAADTDRTAQQKNGLHEHKNGIDSAVEPVSVHKLKPLDLDDICSRILAGSRKTRNNAPLYAEFLAALEPLLQKTEELNLENSGAIHDLISELIFACRSNAISTLRHVSLDLVNLTVFGNIYVQRELIIIWLARLAVHPDAVVQYLALLAAVFLTTKPELISSVINSGMLDLIRPFVQNHPPKKFAKNHLIHTFICACQPPGLHSFPTSCYRCYARATQKWLDHLLPALSEHCSEPRILAAFHFVADFSLRPSYIIKKNDQTMKENQTEKQISSENEVTNEALKRLYKNACSVDPLESELGLRALKIYGKELPHRLSPHVASWPISDVLCWIERVGFKDLQESFSKMKIDGRLLLSLDDSYLQHGLNISNPIIRLRFMRSLTQLKLEADYSSIDHTNLAEWLLWATKLIPKHKRTAVSTKPGKTSDKLEMIFCSSQSHSLRRESLSNLRQYTYNLIAAGIDRMHIVQLTEEELLNDCRIKNGIHRAQILAAVQVLRSSGLDSENLQIVDYFDQTDVPNRELDAFISYRRSSGDWLASLVRAHLQARNYQIFLDVSSMPAGKFPESIQSAIHNSNNFILILTNDALDRCQMDEKLQDWLHREIVLAMEYQCNIIPVFDGKFKWPDPDKLPEDMRQISAYHGITWRHEYQDAWVDELERLMKVRSNLYR